jgi:hypothetical protein
MGNKLSSWLAVVKYGADNELAKKKSVHLRNYWWRSWSLCSWESWRFEYCILNCWCENMPRNFHQLVYCFLHDILLQHNFFFTTKWFSVYVQSVASRSGTNVKVSSTCKNNKIVHVNMGLGPFQVTGVFSFSNFPMLSYFCCFQSMLRVTPCSRGKSRRAKATRPL